jgi:hypothetical protein
VRIAVGRLLYYGPQRREVVPKSLEQSETKLGTRSVRCTVKKGRWIAVILSFRPADTLPSGEVVTLFRLSRTDPDVTMSGVTFSLSTPRFGFTRGEQRLLEYSLLDYTDQEIEISPTHAGCDEEALALDHAKVIRQNLNLRNSRSYPAGGTF